MKKILSLIMFSALLFLMGASDTKAQTSFSQTAYNAAGAITNTSIDTMNLTLSGAYNAKIGVQVVVTKTSGTMAGTAVLYGSMYGTTGTWHSTGDTLTLTNVTTNSGYFTLTEPTYKYLRILVGGATTVAGTCSAKALGIKPN